MTFKNYDRITADPGILGGKPCIRGMRISVQRVLELLATYPDRTTLLEEFPDLEDDDLKQALGFASELLTDTILPLDAPVA